MKKWTIWTIAAVMGISFAALLYLQVRYVNDVIRMRKEQFDESVGRSLIRTARHAELDETREGLELQILETLTPEERESVQQEIEMLSDTITFPLHAATDSSTQFINHRRHIRIPRKETASVLGQAEQTYSDVVRQRYVYQHHLLNEVILNILNAGNEKPLVDRIDFNQLDHDLRTSLRNNGVNIAYHVSVTTADGTEVYRCADYDSTGVAYAYRQRIFQNGDPSRSGVLVVHFPDLENYLFAGVRFLIPSIFFTLVLLVVFILTIYNIFRQKRLTELKNDFINNMTHEFKTPISTISLAAQMLKDPTVGKSDAMFSHISRVINDETKRLRFQVEKVLQMSLFDKRGDTFKPTEVDLNSFIEDVANTFRLKVEAAGGTITTSLTEDEPLAMVDEMHFTNVLFNLMDNAVKYKSDKRPLNIRVKTVADATKATITISDNGIGIKRDDLKKIFARFFRVHTGNRHDVKGFGLGLAYVKNVIDNHKGTITAESEFGKGTRFIITLPIIGA